MILNFNTIEIKSFEYHWIIWFKISLKYIILNGIEINVCKIVLKNIILDFIKICLWMVLKYMLKILLKWDMFNFMNKK